MNQALIHRGPDDGGQHDRPLCSLAMRRLSIIDVAGGRQPICNEDRRFTIVFNGEIYNFKSLREKLVKRGHRFVSEGDTEAIIHLFEDERESAPRHLQGMFAFCIHDSKDDSLFLARDRFGEKPLYYYHHARIGFVFSSEIASLLECPFVPRQLDYEALGYYLRMGYAPAPLTLFRGIRVVPPGHWLRWHNGRITTQCYFHIDYKPDPALEREEDAVAAVQTALRAAVDRQTVSDVPLGAFLSGGIDSSAVVAALQSVADRPVKTFTMRFEQDGFDEGETARRVAEHLGTEHHEFVVPNVSFKADDLWRIVDHVGLPFLDTSAIPTYILSRHIREAVTVALAGDGGDEMFAGYPFFQWGLKIDKARMLPRHLIRAGASLADWMSEQPGLSSVAGIRRVRRGLLGATRPSHMLPVLVHTLFEPEELVSLVNAEEVLSVACGDLPRFSRLPDEAEAWSPLRRLMYFRLKHVLPDRMLTKVDRMSMAASVEVRNPLLDAELAELSMRLPDKHLIQHGVGKYILRRSVRDKLPGAVFGQPKRGFSIPLHHFQNEEYANVARELLSARSEISQLFSAAVVQRTFETGLRQKTDRADRSVFRTSHQLWSLMQLSAWQQRFKVAL